MENITVQINQISTAAYQLNISATEVAATIKDIDIISGESAINAEKVAATTQEQAASVQDIYQQAEKLASEADRLLEEVKQFTI